MVTAGGMVEVPDVGAVLVDEAVAVVAIKEDRAPREAVAAAHLEEEKAPAKAQPDNYDHRRRQPGIIQQRPGHRYDRKVEKNITP
jgi:hypothetical protein